SAVSLPYVSSLTPSLLLPVRFSLYLPRNPCYLHSFPTRRSSDLVFGEEAHHTKRIVGPGRTQALLVDAAVTQLLLTTTEVCVDRSEEHTSELQSRENLVCRLLLEKKKQRHTTLC